MIVESASLSLSQVFFLRGKLQKHFPFEGLLHI